MEPKKGKKVDPLKMLVADPRSIPMKGDPDYSAPGTAWRTDKYREMTYTQFWHLIQQKQIDKVRSPDPLMPGRLRSRAHLLMADHCDQVSDRQGFANRGPSGARYWHISVT